MLKKNYETFSSPCDPLDIVIETYFWAEDTESWEDFVQQIKDIHPGKDLELVKIDNNIGISIRYTKRKENLPEKKKKKIDN